MTNYHYVGYGMVRTMGLNTTLVKKIIIMSLFWKVLQNEDFVGHGAFTLFRSNNRPYLSTPYRCRQACLW